MCRSETGKSGHNARPRTRAGSLSGTLPPFLCHQVTPHTPTQDIQKYLGSQQKYFTAARHSHTARQNRVWDRTCVWENINRVNIFPTSLIIFTGYTLNKLKGSTLVRRSTLELHYIFRRALNLYSFYFVRKCLECFSHALTISCQGTMYVNCICRNSLTSATDCFKPRTHIFLHFRTTDFCFRHIFSNHIRKVQSLICTFGGVFFWDLEKVVANTLTSDWKKTNDSKK